eukprot:scaffold74156_cov74-Attheya_sp.AAC.2
MSDSKESALTAECWGWCCMAFQLIHIECDAFHKVGLGDLPFWLWQEIHPGSSASLWGVVHGVLFVDRGDRDIAMGVDGSSASCPGGA